MNWDPLKTFFKRLGIWVGVFLGVALVFTLMAALVLGALEWQARRLTPDQRQEALASALAWGALAPLPVDADAVELKVLGHAFDRGYELSFEAEPEAIRAWIKASPGLGPLPKTKRRLDEVTVPSSAKAPGRAQLRWHGERRLATLRSWER